MAVRSGLGAQLAIGDESTAGTAVTPTVTMQFISESLDRSMDRLQSETIISGRRIVDRDQRNGGPVTVGGDIGLELQNRGQTKLWKHILGTINTTGSGPYTHTGTIGDLPSGTYQVGIPDVLTGAKAAKTASGCKVASAEVALSAGEIGTLGVTLAGMRLQLGSRTVTDGVTTNASTTLASAAADFTYADKWKSVSGTGIPAGTYITDVAADGATATMSAAATADGTALSVVIGLALISASYPADARPFKFTYGAITLDGVARNVKSCTISIDNGLITDRRFIGDENIHEPLEGGDLRAITGDLVTEFESIADYNRYVNSDQGDMVLTLTAGADSITFTLNVELDGGTPMVSGKGIVEVTYPYTVVGDGSDNDGFQVVLVNADATA